MLHMYVWLICPNTKSYIKTTHFPKKSNYCWKIDFLAILSSILQIIHEHDDKYFANCFNCIFWITKYPPINECSTQQYSWRLFSPYIISNWKVSRINNQWETLRYDWCLWSSHIRQFHSGELHLCCFLRKIRFVCC